FDFQQVQKLPGSQQIYQRLQSFLLSLCFRHSLIFFSASSIAEIQNMHRLFSSLSLHIHFLCFMFDKTSPCGFLQPLTMPLGSKLTIFPIQCTGCRLTGPAWNNPRVYGNGVNEYVLSSQMKKHPVI
ncbi:hypothetical protein ATANTOWER_030145, partial [Ataeniobius toweri]|nr:hypothetical protein [Ataeniobius toweri]